MTLRAALLALLLLPADAVLRQAAGAAPWIAQHALRAAQQHAAVADVAAASSEASHKALLAAQQALSAADAAAQAADFAAAQPDAAAAIQKELDQARDWAQQAKAFAQHAEQTFAQMRQPGNVGGFALVTWLVLSANFRRVLFEEAQVEGTTRSSEGNGSVCS
ncbi:unnamed protein product [Effrenium voratum]|nr:unnamed protein product [Effrenium voratum]